MPSAIPSGPPAAATSRLFPAASASPPPLCPQVLDMEAIARGVRRIVDTVEQVGLDERGFVTHLATREHGRVEGELFLDCSGFAGRIIDCPAQTLKILGPFDDNELAMPT